MQLGPHGFISAIYELGNCERLQSLVLNVLKPALFMSTCSILLLTLSHCYLLFYVQVNTRGTVS